MEAIEQDIRQEKSKVDIFPINNDKAIITLKPGTSLGEFNDFCEKTLKAEPFFGKTILVDSDLSPVQAAIVTHALGHVTKAFGFREGNNFIIAECHDGSYTIGEIIPDEKPKMLAEILSSDLRRIATSHMLEGIKEQALVSSPDLNALKERENVVIVLMGPPHAGKSCLREGLKMAIRQSGSEIYPYVITACPDGEGCWFQQTSENNQTLAKELKDSYKGKFTEGFVNRISESVEKCKVPLTFVDIGGRTSPENKRICATATHGIILVPRDPRDGKSMMEHIAEWQAFNDSLNIKTAAVIISDYFGNEDVLPDQKDGEPLCASIHHLERGEHNENRETAKALAKLCLDIAAKKMEENK